MSRFFDASIWMTLSFQRSFSDARADVRRCARSSFRWPFSTASSAACFSPSATFRSSVRTASFSWRSATFSLTALSLALAVSSCSFASARAMRFGSTVITMS